MPYVPKRHQNSFTFCYQDKDTGIDSLLNINGYFRLKETTRATYGLDSSISIEDTSYYYIMFFRDGIFLSTTLNHISESIQVGEPVLGRLITCVLMVSPLILYVPQ